MTASLYSDTVKLDMVKYDLTLNVLQGDITMAKVKKYSIAVVIIALIIGLVVGGIGTYFAMPAKTVTTTAPAARVTVTTAITKTKTITATPVARPPKYTIYFVSHGGPGDPFWATVIKGVKAAGDLLGVKAVYMGPEKYSIKKLIDMLEGVIAKKPDAIIVTITAYKALDEPLRRAIKMGIPVFAVNVYDPRPEGERIPYLGYLGQDDYEAGLALAENTIRVFKERFGRLPKRMLVGIEEPGHIGLEMRAKGAKEIGDKYGVPVEKLDITTDPTKAIEIVKAYLKKHPDTEVIMTLGPLGAHPMIKFIEEEGLKGKVYHATCDVDSTIVEGIKKDITLVAISQQPFAQGFLSVVSAYLYLEYGVQVPVGNVPAHVRTGPLAITKDTLSLVMKQIEKTGGA